MSVADALLRVLEAAGVRLALKATGDSLTLKWRGELPPHLEAAVRAAKPALLEALRSQAKAAGSKPRPAQGSVAAQPSHCGSCVRWEAVPAWGPMLGNCGAGRRAHGYDGPPGVPVTIHVAHSCVAYGGKGYRARAGTPEPRSRIPASLGGESQHSH